jgi:hypothetical protein
MRIGINVSARTLLDRPQHCVRPIRREDAGSVPDYSCPPGQLEVHRRLLLRRGSVQRTSRTPIHSDHTLRPATLYIQKGLVPAPELSSPLNDSSPNRPSSRLRQQAWSARVPAGRSRVMPQSCMIRIKDVRKSFPSLMHPIP